MSIRKSPKIQKLVVNAIRKLQDVEGATPREISNYISQEYDVPATKIQRQVRLALARAVSYGILQRTKGGYVCNRDFGSCHPQMEEGELTEKCGRRKSRRRKSSGGCKRRRSKKRRGCRSSRRRSRRRKSGRRKCGGKRSRRRRRSRRGGKCRRRGRRGHRSKRRRGGKRCAPNGGPGGSDDDFQVFPNRRRRGRGRTVSASRRGNRSLSSGSFEEDRLDDKRDNAQPIESPETLLD